jgi:hypothetical protein
MQMFAVPIVRVAVETQHTADMPKLIKGKTFYLSLANMYVNYVNF